MQKAAASLPYSWERGLTGMLLKSLKFIKIRMELTRAISCNSYEECPFHSRYSQTGFLGIILLMW